MSDFIRSVDLKLSRAKIQVQQLNETINLWSERNLLSVRCEKHDGDLGFRVFLNAFPEPAPLDDWSLTVGEFIHNLRSLLDNLVYALARLKNDPPKVPKSIFFCITKNKASFSQYKSTCLSQLPSNPALLIEMLQPFQRDGSPENGTPESDPLLFLQELNNSDKHRVPSVVLFAPKEINHSFSFEITDGEQMPPDVIIWDGPLEPNCILLDCKTKFPIKKISGSVECRATVSLLINNKSNELIPMLQGLGSYTELVVAQFRRFFE